MDKERTHGGHTRQTQEANARGRHRADKVWRRGQGGHTADTWRTHGGHIYVTGLQGAPPPHGHGPPVPPVVWCGGMVVVNH